MENENVQGQLWKRSGAEATSLGANMRWPM